jgi:hypothetical protein
MYHFVVDGSKSDNGCQVCCCEKMALVPGTTTKVSLIHSWAMPVGFLHCAPQFQIELLDTCVIPIAGNNLPPAITSVDGMAKFQTDMNAPLTEDLKTRVSDPDGDVLTFKILPLYAPKHGKIILDPKGMFTYTPSSNWFGEERFYASASDGKNAPFIFEVMIAVGIDPGPMIPQPHISIGPAVVNQQYFSVYFPVTVSPAAQQCEIWRLTVIQSALDCNCICFSDKSCYDIGIAKC